jgi:hypothetical protein
MPDPVNIWSTDPALDTLTGVLEITEEIVVATAAQTLVAFTTFTVIDVSSLAVHINGIRQLEGATNSYVLTTESSVTFSEGLTEDDQVHFVFNAALADPPVVTPGSTVSISTPAATVTAQRITDAQSAQSVAELRDLSGIFNGNIALVADVVNPINQYYWAPASSAVDDGITTIKPTLTTGAGRWILSRGNFIDTIALIFSTGAAILDRIIFLGGTTIADGAGGIFYWNPATTRSTANGTSILDPTVSLINQGTGTGTGCYIRVSTF